MPSVKAPPSSSAGPTDRVVRALQNPSWDWRTLESLVRETFLSDKDVLEAIQLLGPAVVRGKADDGREVYRLRRPTEPVKPSESTLFWYYLTKSSSSST
jgi:hypothetical protein